MVTIRIQEAPAKTISIAEFRDDVRSGIADDEVLTLFEAVEIAGHDQVQEVFEMVKKHRPRLLKRGIAKKLAAMIA